jgi:hypothetical protein
MYYQDIIVTKDDFDNICLLKVLNCWCLTPSLARTVLRSHQVRMRFPFDPVNVILLIDKYASRAYKSDKDRVNFCICHQFFEIKHKEILMLVENDSWPVANCVEPHEQDSFRC